MTEFFNLILINPFINLLVLIYKLIYSLSIPYALGFSIIALTILVRLVTYPLTNSQLRASTKMQELKPHMDRIKEKHKNDKARIQQETMKLYQEHKINPAAGCVPLLIQLPIFIALYNVLIQIVNSSSQEGITKINEILYSPFLHLDSPWDPNFFGVSLAATPGEWTQKGVFLLFVPIITGALQFIQSKMMLPKQDPKEKKSGKEDDFQKTLQTQMTYFLPVMIGFFSYTFPIGLSLYWNVFSLFGIIQQYLLQRQTASKK